MERYLFLLLLFVALGVLQMLFWGLWDARTRRARLHRSIARKGQVQAGPALALPSANPMHKRLQGYLTRMAAVTLERVSVVKGSEAEASDALLKAAGIRSRDAHLVYAFLKLVLPVAGALLALLWLMFNSSDGVKPLSAIIGVSGCALIFSRAPDAFLVQRRRKRLERVRRAFPDMLELLVIVSEAGLGPVPALRRVARELQISSPDLSLELQQLVLELTVLPQRAEAWRNLEERLPLPEISVFANALVQAERYGTPFRAALRNLMQDTRSARLLQIEEKAGRLPALMTIPLIVFIMPALFVVLIGPAVLSILDNIMQGGAGG
ncbi:type II secretion system F family protein [Celeribacter sp. SCSIO 80788]|uniref:type II secretion system F family protein n=1 Tax=Celeribacter sp. SCSIO 80788 TaxID=3117013 RepID=UPI003DA53F89